MVNIDDFVKRLEIILDYYSLNASTFADKIGVQRSSMSHLLSGRNKPSLDFVLKILDVFPDVDLYWILNGKGSFPKREEEIESFKIEKDLENERTIATISSQENIMAHDLFSSIEIENEKPSQSIKQPESKTSNITPAEGEIEKIVFFYKNGTFKVYVP
ncbi:helix-turn-helix domain-containing protein [Flavobacterium hercynium]|uniref:Transcriptional regulator n=1 Tax=Flavobacterium hercynium TaxID=387094 RepID=A0A226H9K4_9FLAO|nr:helix-turn-helix transcriptional regulator [Flavobacterium hercynium]OXA90953.1 transcriptional regulator [Flavobacterium hercynium]SMP36392.1 Helix-turn-helix [Flavobacterium hercynium]